MSSQLNDEESEFDNLLPIEIIIDAPRSVVGQVLERDLKLSINASRDYVCTYLPGENGVITLSDIKAVREYVPVDTMKCLMAGFPVDWDLETKNSILSFLEQILESRGLVLREDDPCLLSYLFPFLTEHRSFENPTIGTQLSEEYRFTKEITKTLREGNFSFYVFANPGIIVLDYIYLFNYDPSSNTLNVDDGLQEVYRCLLPIEE